MSDDTVIPRDFAEGFPGGALCGCDCGCDRVLNEGNVMGETIVEAERDWNGDVLSVPIVLVICSECYVGSHASERPL